MQITTFRSNLISKGYDIVTGTPRTFAKSTSRDYFMVTNLDTTNSIEVAFGPNPDPADFIRIGAGGYFEPNFTPTSAITVKASVGTISVIVITDEHNSST